MLRIVAFECLCRFSEEEARVGLRTALNNLRASVGARGLCNGPQDEVFFEQVLSGKVSSSEVLSYVMSQAETA